MATQPPYPGAVTPPPNSGLAITALVLGVAGLVSCGLVTGIPAISFFVDFWDAICGSEVEQEC